MIELTKEQVSCISELYKECNDSTVWSCLQGYMGRAWVDCFPNPTVARIVQGCYCFPAGDVSSCEADVVLNDFPPEINKYELTFIPHTKEWEDKFKQMPEYTIIKRYAIKKEGLIFSEETLLNHVKSLPDDYKLCQIDKELYELALSEGWSEDFCSNYKTAEEFIKLGLGYVILHNNQIVCGASSYTVYDGGFEVEIATRVEYRRQGLAKICGARLLLECMKMGKYPNWDAANPISVKIAESLGYHFDKEYNVFELDSKL